MRKFFFISLLSLSLFLILPIHAEIIDSDHDGLSDSDEINIYHTHPNDPDTDTDGYTDGEEIKNGYSPLLADKKLSEVDTDKDGLTDAQELILGTDLANSDTDSDGYPDGVEVLNNFDPLNAEPVKVTKRIEVNLKKQQLTYYFGVKKMEEFLISSGIAKLPTPKGEFKILEKKPIVNYKGPGYYLPNTKWNLLFSRRGGGLFIHGAYWHHNFGHPMSHGCVNVAYANMEYLYKWAQVGTRVAIR